MTDEQTKIVDKYLRKFKKLEELADDDGEYAHRRADTILLEAISEIGSPELKEAWERVRTKCGGFYYS